MDVTPLDRAIGEAYYHPRTGFGGVEATFQAAKANYPGLTRAHVREFLAKQENRQRRKPRGGNSFVPDFVRQEFQIDLADFGERAKPRYALVAVDIMSKKACVVPVATKTTTQSAEALQKVFDELGYPASIMIDEGGEFFSHFTQVCEKEEIDLIRSRTGARFVERFIRTLKLALADRVRALGRTWTHYVQDVVDHYNDTVHTVTRMKPDTLHKSDLEGYALTRLAHARIQAHAKFPVVREPIVVGDHVKIRTKQPGVGYKESTFNSWSSAVYMVEKVEQQAVGTLYYLQNYRRPLLRYELLKVHDVQRPVSGTIKSVLQERLHVPPAPAAAAVAAPSVRRARVAAPVFKPITRAAAKSAAATVARTPAAVPTPVTAEAVPHHVAVARAAAEEAPRGKKTRAFFQGLAVASERVRPAPAAAAAALAAPVRRPATRSQTLPA